MDKMRQEFEVFAEERGFDPNYYFTRSVHPNYYDHDTVNEMWLAWQASRAALRVDLPDSEYSYDCGYVLYRSDVESALDQAGVSYE